MEEKPGPVLSYEARTTTTRYRFVRWFCFAAVIGVLAIGFVAYTTSHRMRVTTRRLTKDQTAIGIPYGKYFFLRDGADLVAIKIAAGSANPISYDWMYLANDKMDFGSATTVKGTGSTREINGNGQIVAGPFRLEWSQGGIAEGWVYWDASRPQLSIFSELVTDPATVKLSSSKTKWYRRSDPFP